MTVWVTETQVDAKKSQRRAKEAYVMKEIHRKSQRQLFWRTSKHAELLAWTINAQQHSSKAEVYLLS